MSFKIGLAEMLLSGVPFSSHNSLTDLLFASFLQALVPTQ